MAKLLQVDFNIDGPFGEQLSNNLRTIADSINQEPGFIWKIWTENANEKLAGGVYLFEDEASAKSYLKMHSERLTAIGATNIRGYIFDINEPLSNVNKGPIRA